MLSKKFFHPWLAENKNFPMFKATALEILFGHLELLHSISQVKLGRKESQFPAQSLTWLHAKPGMVRIFFQGTAPTSTRLDFYFIKFAIGFPLQYKGFLSNSYKTLSSFQPAFSLFNMPVKKSMHLTSLSQ